MNGIRTPQRYRSSRSVSQVLRLRIVPFSAPREDIGGEDRVVEDLRLGLAAQQVDLDFIPERDGLARVKLGEPGPRLGIVALGLMGHRQERRILRLALAAPKLNPLLQARDRLGVPPGSIECAAQGNQRGAFPLRGGEGCECALRELTTRPGSSSAPGAMTHAPASE